MQAETFEDSFPPSDKSLSRLLDEASYLLKSVINLLECICSHGNSENADKDIQSGDRVANKLYSIPSISQRIDDFPNEMSLSAISDLATDTADANGLVSE
ncbi:unnamed protein product [Citrullus colocynthis]|uniref:Uncharacterized protein n=1 Tax=Citrullus colocynthis TaxID=252529 RepID=A0ABP0ZCN3_9ROSI